MLNLNRSRPPAHVLEDAVSDHDALEGVADTLQTLLRGAEATLPPGVMDALHGEWLGHPLHPILVHLPLGGWMIAAALDHLPARSPGANDAAADR
ncbi:hypothetical protein IHN58_12265, partial [Deinococcus sp. 12RED42]|nr:hypothetical protein [Deinococcus sp. 12RED42]